MKHKEYLTTLLLGFFVAISAISLSYAVYLERKIDELEIKYQQSVSVRKMIGGRK